MPLSQSIIDKAAKVLQEWGNEATFQMQKLLKDRAKAGKKYGSSNMSNLSQSINWDGSQVTTDGATAIWNLNDYWVYIDLGVKGIKNRDSDGNITKTYTSKDFPQGFRFRNYGVPPAMKNNLQSYIARNGIKVRKSKNQDAKEVIADSFKMAAQMGYFIKRKGIDGTRFYSDVFNDKGFKKLSDRLEKALGQEIEVRIITELKR